MKRYQILYNPYAGNGRGQEEALKLKETLQDGLSQLQDMTAIEDYSELAKGLKASDILVVVGGDGTLHRFINDTQDVKLANRIYYYAAGTGNDFWLDLGYQKGDPPVCINSYIKRLPTIEVKNRKYKILNGVGYGIDGYCCEVGDRKRERKDKAVNYTSIAIQGLLFHYHPTNAVIFVDGIKYTYKKVWLAPTMNGRFYGGGMMPAPNQERMNREGTVTAMVMHGCGKVKTLRIFPSIFSGKHIAYTKNVDILEGKDISVFFDRPTALQVDGETITGVTSYHIYAAEEAAKEIDESNKMWA